MAPRNDGQRRRKNAVINKDLIAAAELRDLSGLIRTIETNLSQMNLVNITTAMHRLAKVVEGDSESHAMLLKLPMIQTLLSAARTELLPVGGFCPRPSTQSLSNILWSAAVLGLDDIVLFQACAELTVTHIDEFKAMELSTLIWSCAKLDEHFIEGSCVSLRWAGPIFDAAVNHICSQVNSFTFRNLATTVGAFAKVGKANPHVFDIVAKQMLTNMHMAKRQELAKTAWAYGTANFCHEELFMALAKHALPMISSFHAKELSNLLWGFAANEILHTELFAKASTCAQRADLNTQGLANIMWALTRLRPKHPMTSSTIRALLPRCIQLLPTFKPQEIASTALSVSKSLVPEAEDAKKDLPGTDEALDFLNRVMPIVLIRIHEFSAQSLANLATAHAGIDSDASMGFVATIGLHVHQRADRLEMTVLLQLIRVFCPDTRMVDAKAPFADAYLNVACALFKVVARHVHRCKVEERASLIRLVKLIYRHQGDDDLSLQDLERYCLVLARGTESNDSVACKTPDSSEDESYMINRGVRKLSLAETLVAEPVKPPFVTPTSRAQFPTKPSQSGFRLKNRVLSPPMHSELIQTQRIPNRQLSESIHDDRSEMTSETDRSALIAAGAPLTINDLQAFRKDYQELRAVPALDYRHERIKEDALSKTMKQNRRQEKIEALGPPLDILARNLDLDTLQAYRADYQDLRAIPALDFVPKRVSPSSWLLQDIVDSSLKNVEPETLGPPLDIFSAALEDAMSTNSSLKRVEDAKTPLQPSYYKTDGSFREELSSQGSSSEYRFNFRPLKLGPLAVEYEDLQAFRKDYQELRAVPGLDFRPQAKHDSLETTNLTLSMFSKTMKQHRKEVSDLEGLGPPLAFVSANADAHSIQAFRTNYQNLRACPALDFIPRHICPSNWLMESTTSDERVSLARAENSVEPDSLGPPLDIFTQQQQHIGE